MTKQLKPGVLAASVATGALVAAGLAALGFWQLDRADHKRELLHAYEARGGDPLDIATADAGERFTAVAASGRYDAGRQILIDNMVAAGRNGFFVITPLGLDDGTTVLVNRGWVPQDPARLQLPDIAVSAERRGIEGLSGALPVAGLDLGEPAAATGWPRVAQFPSFADIERMLGGEVRRPLILLAPDQPDGYRRQWRPTGMTAERHVGYAVQWFALAATAMILFLVIGFRKTTRQ
ncbi:MAG: SURF1 family protein [Pseudomonadota bacterium]